MIWNPEAEILPREALAELQLRRLRETVARVLAAVPPMRDRLRAAGLSSAEEVRSLDDLARLPFSAKPDLREHYPFSLLAVPREDIVRVHASSGTRGKPTVVGYTRADLATFAEVTARTLARAGVRPGMVFHNAAGYGLFTGGLGMHAGAELLGCTVVPVGGGFTRRQVTLLVDLGAQAIHSTPSYALNIADAIQEMGVDPAELKLEVGVFGAEPWTREMRPELERRLGLRAVNAYGLSEIIGPGVASECAEVRDGLHVEEDHFLPEIVDPESGAPLPPGAEGELVITTLTKEALPLIRYRTGDISALDPTPCACGRTTARIVAVRGRRDDMLIIRGVNLYPSEVERILLGLGEVAPHYQLVVERPGALDEPTVLCEPATAGADAEALRARIARALRDGLGLAVAVRVLAPGEVPRSEGKAVRVVDLRPR